MAYRTEESSLMDKILDWLDAKQKEGAPLFWEHRSGSGGFNYKKGVPDLYVVASGHHIPSCPIPGGSIFGKPIFILTPEHLFSHFTFYLCRHLYL